MDRDAAHALQRSSLRRYVEMVGSSSPGARTLERDGVLAAIVPATPDRSIPNSVAYDGPAQLAAAYDELAAAYDEAGVTAWTVWVPDFDREAIELLDRAGHAFDGEPAAMSLDLARFEPPDLGDLDWDADASAADLGRVNDAAYGFEPGTGYALGLAGVGTAGDPRLRLYRARVEGAIAAVLGTIDADGDCGIYFVATDRAYAGRRIAGRLLAAALIEARERGCATSSLQSSRRGQPVYEALGYDLDFRLHLYERRRG